MEAIENAAFILIGRACGFASLAVLYVMLGLSSEPFMAVRVGGALGTTLAFILAIFAARAPARPYKYTEVWSVLAKEKRPPAPVAQRIIGQALRDSYLWFAERVAFTSIFLLAMSLGLQFIGPP